MPFDALPPEPRPIPAAEILLHAEVKFLMNRSVWVREYPEGGRNECLVSAIISATREKGFGNQQCDEACQLVAKVIDLRPYKSRRDMRYAIAYWNDTDGRTVADIQRVLREAQRLAYANVG
jgi:hypothetical protein